MLRLRVVAIPASVGPSQVPARCSKPLVVVSSGLGATSSTAATVRLLANVELREFSSAWGASPS
jgi:hypothetical protein